MHERTRGIWLTTLGVAVLSLDALLIRLISADHWTLLLWRGLLLSASVGAFYLVREGRGSVASVVAIGRHGVGSALLYALSTVTFVIAVKLTSVANTLIILSAAPLLAALLSGWWLGERVARRTWLAILLCCGGILLVFSGSRIAGALLGDLCALLCACGLAGKFVVERAARPRNMAPALIPAGLMISAAAWLAGASWTLSVADWLWIGLLGGVVIPLAYALITQGPRYLQAPEVGLIMLLEMLLGPLWVWLVMAEAPSREAWLGGAVVLGALALQTLPARIVATRATGVSGIFRDSAR